MAKELKVPGEYQSRTPRSKQNIFPKQKQTMNREYTEQDYKNYMKVVEHVIWETEEKLKSYEKNKKIFSLTFEQWVQWQNNVISLDDIKIDSDDKTI
jgi:hypothetical protein